MATLQKQSVSQRQLFPVSSWGSHPTLQTLGWGDSTSVLTVVFCKLLGRGGSHESLSFDEGKLMTQSCIVFWHSDLLAVEEGNNHVMP